MESQKRMSFTLAASFNGADDMSPEAQAVWYRKMLETQPVRYQPEYDLWEVFRYDDVQRVLKDYETFSAEMLLEGFPDAITLNSDPPRHRRYRSLMTKAFTPRSVTLLAPRITAIVDEILGRADVTGSIDIVEQLAYPLPVRVIGEMLGVPREDQERFRRWSYQLFDILPHPDDPHNHELAHYFVEQLKLRAENLRDDLMSALLTAEIDGERLTQEETCLLCMVLLAAGNVTTTMLLSAAARRFVKQPEIFQALRDNPGLIPSAIEEVLRHDFTGVSMMRLARHDTTIGGYEIKAGQVVIAWLSAANFDEAYFADAERFNVRRSPNPHLSFGHGIHFCLGAPLARLETKIALEQMIAHWSEIRSDSSQPLQSMSNASGLMQGFPVLVTPISAPV